MKQGKHNNQGNQPAKEDDLEESIIEIGRKVCVTSGGRVFGFQCVSVVGDKKGTIGLGIGKALEVPEAVKKSVANARKNLIKVNLKDNHGHLELFHEGSAKQDGAQVLVRPAPMGTAIQAGGTMRIIFEAAGITNVRAKSLGSNNKYNVAQACFEVLKDQENIEELINAREGGSNG